MKQIVFVEKAKPDLAGLPLSEIKTKRASGDVSPGPTGTVKIRRTASSPCGDVDAMDQEALRGVNEK
jgi:hypothetical protein